MNRTLVNFCVDTGLLIAYALLVWSSTVLHLVFPAGIEAAGWTIWGWDYLAWRGFQFANLVVLTLGVLLHVMLHWNWVCGVIATRFLRDRSRMDSGTQTLYGVGLLILLLALIGAATVTAKLSLQSPHREKRMSISTSNR